jgi:hypothetical protein
MASGIELPQLAQECVVNCVMVFFLQSRLAFLYVSIRASLLSPAAS